LQSDYVKWIQEIPLGQLFVKQHVVRAARQISHPQTNSKTMQHGTQNATPGGHESWRVPRSWRDAPQSVVFAERTGRSPELRQPHNPVVIRMRIADDAGDTLRRSTGE
jgi:hypothetical protein